MALPLLEPSRNFFKRLCWLSNELSLAGSYVVSGFEVQRHASAVICFFVSAVFVTLHALTILPVPASYNITRFLLHLQTITIGRVTSICT